MFPIRWNAPPAAVRRGVPGMHTHPKVSLIEAPLPKKGGTVGKVRGKEQGERNSGKVRGREEDERHNSK